ncbi:MAG TPA: GGDEF domain-containing protein [Anaeromyxobacteraceae bacterium]|nr:GGDEF domain-containing protein [Anaeromyxobacteraceae bacterium]
MASRQDELERTWSAAPRLGEPGRKHAFLLVLAGPQFGEIHPLQDGCEVVIGRRGGSEIRLLDDGISRRHASIRVEGEGAVIRDLGSANGTYVDGKRVSEARLSDGSRVHLGAQTTLKFAWTDELEARYQMRLAESALQDPLTGLYNRRHFEERLGAELAAAQRHARPVSLLLVDIDHFKSVNDRHGHLAGDEALKRVGAVLGGALRKEDVLARYGVEEFVVIARETGLAGAGALAERIRQAVERAPLTWEGSEVGLTVSVGVTVAAGIPEYVAGRTDRELFQSADRALYAAKQGGRNRVVVAPFDPGSAGGKPRPGA